MNHWQGWLYVAAVLIPLAAFAVQLLGIRVLGRLNAYLATGAIATAFALSVVGFVSYSFSAPGFFSGHAEEAGHGEAEAEAGHADSTHHAAPADPFAFTGSFNWVSIGGRLDDPALHIPFGIYIDSLAAIMFVMVTFIASLIHLYSMGYMRDDVRYPRFFAYLSLFCFSMLGLVASSNVFMIFIFWELVGLCSYLLIGHWYEEKKNADAANKAFVTNRIGDVGMLMGLGLLWSALGTFNIHDINRALADPDLRDGEGRLTRPVGDVVTLSITDTDSAAESSSPRERTIPYGMLMLAGVGIFAGCMGKSAQTPLHVWLPDAMAGPTPVSALIHAATMVAAGVYLVGRFFPLFTAEVLTGIAYVGGATLFIAATIAVVQTDYKKVLAYSTVSQLGFMMLALGVGGWAAGLFHLLTHAFFKALLFLGAGSVYHAVHTYELPALGGLYPKMRTTALTMLAATLAISGVPFFSGFYSKDAILAASIHFVEVHPQHILLFLLPALGATITAFYMFRMWFLLFTGTSRSAGATHGHDHHHGHDDHGHHGDPVEHAHESEPVMAWPLVALAIPTIMIGWSWIVVPIPGSSWGTPVLESWLEYGVPVALAHDVNAHWWAMGASLVIATVGIGLAAAFYWAPYRRFDAGTVARRFAPVHQFLAHKWYFDEVYDRFLVRPTLALSRAVTSFDRHVIDGVVNGSAGATVLLSQFEGFFDKFAVDGLVNLFARVIYVLGDWGRTIQTGRLRTYLMVLAFGVVLLFLGIFFWVRPAFAG